MGVHRAIASRTAALARRVGITPEVTFTGGVSRNVAMVMLLQEELRAPLNVSAEAHFCGALEAALFAYDRAFETEWAEQQPLELAAAGGA
jgi:activator of 2-hydroxyglutaryl-CoA dehydratase